LCAPTSEADSLAFSRHEGRKTLTGVTEHSLAKSATGVFITDVTNGVWFLICITNFTEEFGLQNLLIELAEKKRNE
jgi:hypothetical protein